MTTTMTNKFRRLVAVAAVLALFGTGSAARAADPPVGAVKVENRSDVELKITNLKYTDRDGKEVSASGTWKLAPSADEYLRLNGEKIYASKIVYDVTTEEGTTRGWTVKATGLGADFASYVSADNLTEHRKLLGKPYVPFKPADPVKPAGPDPVKLANAQAEVAGLEARVKEAGNKILGARFAEAAAIAVYNNSRPGSGQEFLASIALATVRRELADAESEQRSSDSSLRVARERLNAVQYER